MEIVDAAPNDALAEAQHQADLFLLEGLLKVLNYITDRVDPLLLEKIEKAAQPSIEALFIRDITSAA
jgi:hypothetical protein